ncbi:hypothetical protein MASR2M117_12290 [Paludibacter sp.]
MKKYTVVLSEQAESDLEEYINYIMSKCKAPLTALRNYEDLFTVINSLRSSPESCSLQTRKSLILQFGFGVRRINYKKMAIIYTIHSNIVYIRRIIAGSMIAEL